MSSTVCMYHRVDMDGMLSGEMIRRYVQYTTKETCTMFGFNYEKEVCAKYLMEKYPQMKTLYIVDSSLHPNDIIKLVKSGIKVVWLDHHRSIIDEFLNDDRFTYTQYKTHVSPINELREIYLGPHEDHMHIGTVAVGNKCSACRLVYEYLKNNCHPLVEEYAACKILSTYVSTFDIWDEKAELWDDALCFNTACTMFNFFPGSDDWNYFFLKDNSTETANRVKEQIEKGRIYLEYQKQCDAHSARRYAGTLIWEGKRFCAINTTRAQSQTVDTVFDRSIHDAVLVYVYDPSGVWKVSMYSSNMMGEEDKKNLDLSPIARKYGGGGHKGACGFSCKQLPFNVLDIQPIVAEQSA